MWHSQAQLQQMQLQVHAPAAQQHVLRLRSRCLLLRLPLHHVTQPCSLTWALLLVRCELLAWPLSLHSALRASPVLPALPQPCQDSAHLWLGPHASARQRYSSAALSGLQHHGPLLKLHECSAALVQCPAAPLRLLHGLLTLAHQLAREVLEPFCQAAWLLLQMRHCLGLPAAAKLQLHWKHS